MGLTGDPSGGIFAYLEHVVASCSRRRLSASQHYHRFNKILLISLLIGHSKLHDIHAMEAPSLPSIPCRWIGKLRPCQNADLQLSDEK